MGSHTRIAHLRTRIVLQNYYFFLEYASIFHNKMHFFVCIHKKGGLVVAFYTIIPMQIGLPP